MQRATIRADVAWLAVAPLLVWSLAAGAFPALAPELAAASYWWMAAVAVAGFVLSILVKALLQVLAARRLDLQVEDVTLLAFGGVARRSAAGGIKAEFLMALTGALTGICLGILLLLLLFATASPAMPLSAAAVLFLLGLLNWLLGAVSLVPAHPLPGGRLLRAILLRWTGDAARATRLAAGFAVAIGAVILVAGLMHAAGESLLGGLWLAAAGLLLCDAAGRAWREAR